MGAATVGAALLAAGCGSSGSHVTTSAAPAKAASTQATTSTSAAAGALSAEATSAATGDIPDNQVFLVFGNKSAGYSIKYPEGWTQSGSSTSVTFSSKNNQVRVVIAAGTAPTTASVTAGLQSLKRANPSLVFTVPQQIQLPSGAAVKATYKTQSPPNPVTGKSVTLIVNRYELSRGGKVATVDEGTPVGVDNVDAYRMMIQSFRWL
jgi:hypothetical protein